VARVAPTSSSADPQGCRPCSSPNLPGVYLLAPLAGLAATLALTVGASRDLEALFELAMRLWAR